jgi:hypothetical protein
VIEQPPLTVKTGVPVPVVVAVGVYVEPIDGVVGAVEVMVTVGIASVKVSVACADVAAA